MFASFNSFTSPGPVAVARARDIGKTTGHGSTQLWLLHLGSRGRMNVLLIARIIFGIALFSSSIWGYIGCQHKRRSREGLRVSWCTLPFDLHSG
ncbi:hypothetical protein L218DRAFT_629198 [Marasmius fiardii PR-910]|nr:hypothetical protein L218DRAFT_629198 [Marasmius fiardii PR-910]